MIGNTAFGYYSLGSVDYTLLNDLNCFRLLIIDFLLSLLRRKGALLVGQLSALVWVSRIKLLLVHDVLQIQLELFLSDLRILLRLHSELRI